MRVVSHSFSVNCPAYQLKKGERMLKAIESASPTRENKTKANEPHTPEFQPWRTEKNRNKNTAVGGAGEVK
jgi:hypothetical protein